MKRSKNTNRSGFTLIEALIATALIGIAIAALMTSNISHSQANAYGMDTSTAEFLVEEVRAMMMSMDFIDPNDVTDTFGTEEGEYDVADYDDLDDFDGVTISPPVDISGNVLSDFSEYSQSVIVETLNPADLTSVLDDYESKIVRISVSIQKNGREISSASWIQTQR
jgi:prepilin-type N-terminal cleavage/methylation domain-containing protein